MSIKPLSINAWDIITIFLYFLIVVGIGLWSSFKNRNTVDGFFIARRAIHFIPVGASLFASCIGTSLFIGLSGSAANSGIAVAGFELNAVFVLILLGWLFVPVYIRAGVYTMPEYIKKRFGGERIRIFLSILSLLLNLFIRITADLFGGALFIKMYLKIDLYVAIGILLLLSALFTIGGGASAVIWTDFIQTVFMILGALTLMVISYVKVDGIQTLIAKYSYAIPSTTVFSNTTCGIPNSNYFDLHRSASDSDFPWTGMQFGLTISAVWYWCSDQVIVQRALAAKNLTHAKAACVFAGLLKLLPLFMIIIPGMISRVLFNEEVGCIDPEECMQFCGSRKGCSNVAYPKLIIDMMPDGARGIMVAVMMAALMSSLTSVFNSCSVIFTMDLYKRIRCHASDIELMVVGRIFVVAFVIISILWIPVIEASQGSRLFDYIQSVTSFLAPPVCAVYIQAVLFRRINEPGAFWGLIIGLMTGMIRFVWQFSYVEPACVDAILDKRPAIIKNVHFLHFGIISFVITCVSSWTISLLTPPIPDKYTRRLTYFSVHDEEEAEVRDEDKIILEKQIKKKDMKAAKLLNCDFKRGVKKGSLRRLIESFCGIEGLNNRAVDTEETKADLCIEQSRFESGLCNVSALLVMGICGFCYAFFNRF